MNLYSNMPKSPIIFKYEIDDKVRIPLKKHVFEKGYTQNWTEEVFKIKQTATWNDTCSQDSDCITYFACGSSKRCLSN